MAATLKRTSVPGIYKRGRRYVVEYRDANGKQRWESAPTFDAARRLKAARSTDVTRGEFEPLGRIGLHAYAREWTERYQGTGRRGFREETRDEYRGLLERYALRYFGARVRLRDLTPAKIAGFIAWLCDARAQAENDHALKVEGARERGKPAPKRLASDARRELSDNTIRNAFRPLATCLATARREGLIRHNPASEAALPHRPEVEEETQDVRPFPPGAAELVIEFVHPQHRLMFELLDVSGVRRSELLAFEGRHLHLSGDRPYVKVRQRVRRQRGKGLVIGPVKSGHSRRDLPIPIPMAERLVALGRGPNELVFQSQEGTMLDPDNLYKRVLSPACEEADVGWAGFHTFRHTVASRLFAAGRNIVQVQKWLGHHSPSFTLDTYVHLLDGDIGEPLERAGGANKVQTQATGNGPNAASAIVAEFGKLAAQTPR